MGRGRTRPIVACAHHYVIGDFDVGVHRIDGSVQGSKTKRETEMLYRRSVIKGLAGLPLARVLADPLITQAVAAGLETVTITTKGGQSVSAALALPANTPAPAIVLIHEWWGLNDQIKAVAAEFTREATWRWPSTSMTARWGRVRTSPRVGARC